MNSAAAKVRTALREWYDGPDVFQRWPPASMQLSQSQNNQLSPAVNRDSGDFAVVIEINNPFYKRIHSHFIFPLISLSHCLLPQ